MAVTAEGAVKRPHPGGKLKVPFISKRTYKSSTLIKAGRSCMSSSFTVVQNFFFVGIPFLVAWVLPACGSFIYFHKLVLVEAHSYVIIKGALEESARL